jgi:hypothetical protein
MLLFIHFVTNWVFMTFYASERWRKSTLPLSWFTYQSTSIVVPRIEAERREISKTIRFVLPMTQTIRINFANDSAYSWKRFFVRLAKSKNFDPLDAEKWYSITHKDILRAVSSLLCLLFMVHSSHLLNI